MTFLFLAPLMLGRSLWSPSCLPFLAPIDFLVGFHRLADGLPGEHPHDRIHEDVAHDAHSPGPPALGVPDLGAPTGHLRRRALSGRLISTSSSCCRRSTSTSTTLLRM